LNGFSIISKDKELASKLTINLDIFDKHVLVIASGHVDPNQLESTGNDTSYRNKAKIRDKT
jgi:hypothetical protein